LFEGLPQLALLVFNDGPYSLYIRLHNVVVLLIERFLDILRNRLIVDDWVRLRCYYDLLLVFVLFDELKILN
jgi:hypothetical protein